MTTEYTTNFRFNLPDFRMGPWHDLININTVNIDELLMGIGLITGTTIWTNNTLYTVGQIVIDTTEYSIWMCRVSHTSGLSPLTFAQDRAAHPTYWVLAGGVIPVTSVTITTTGIVIPTNVRDVYFNAAVPITVTLPTASAWATVNPGADARLLLKDISGTADVNNITINCAVGNSADGLTSFKISMKWNKYTLRVTPTNNWMMI